VLLLSGLRVWLTPTSVTVTTLPLLAVEVSMDVTMDGALVVSPPWLSVVVTK
jgi:hypothetical protein